jgi:glutaredoxin 3
MSMRWYSPGLSQPCAVPYNGGRIATERPKTIMPIIEIYTTRYCPYCHAAKALLKRKGVAFTEIDLGRDWERRDEMIERANGSMTVPQIFIGSVHVGGSNELHALDDAGMLDPLLAGDKASA